MAKFKDLTNKKFGKLTVIKKSDVKVRDKHIVWQCKCECGNIIYVRSNDLVYHKQKSCGCLIGYNRNNLSHKRIYRTWYDMNRRCDDLSNKNYGGRGISVCSEWKDKKTGFDVFYEWAYKNGYNDTLTIDRINNDGNYEPSNCRWVTKQEQQKNKRNTIKYSWKNNKYTLKELSVLFNIPEHKLKYRIDKNFSIEDIAKLCEVA